MEMTQEQIEIEAQNYLNGLDLPENADKQLILDNFKNGMDWAMMLLKEDKQQWIDKENKNNEKAKEIAEYLNQPNGSNSLLECHQAAMAMAWWKDEQFAQEKRKWIIKACEFWEHKFPYTYLIDTIKEFADAMEEEL